MMSILAKLILKILKKTNLKELSKHQNTNIKIGNFCDFKFYNGYKNISFGKDINVRDNCHFLVGKNASLKIENNVFFNNNCSINCLDSIEIGENTLIGESVKLYDHNHEYTSSPNFKVEHQKFTTAPVKIGKNCWLGSNVIVIKGVTIGDNTIIGAGCVIHKDVPANSVIINKQEQIVKST
ncbi:DapH/DapD/GlmU-related protein [Soonwooa sp.]|uniref:acyltransferase n=1 Tax=Soonwooa sp. TaxID=1938592 RepID=UPI0035B4AD5E